MKPRSMKLRTWLYSAALATLLAGCGGGSNTVSIAVTPSTASVAPGSTQQFTADVHHTTNAAVTWQVNGVDGGNSTFGTISSSGLFTAPGLIPSPSSYSVTAISVADNTKSASSTVVIAPPISISPASASVAATGTQQFSATVTFSTNTAVTWEVNSVAGGNSTVGTISDTGLYTAPSAVSSPSTVQVMAVSKADATRTASAPVTITAPPLTISPNPATVIAGTQQVFTATALSVAVTPLWSVSCSSTVAGGCGSIAADGTYTAPPAPPPGGSVTIRADSQNGGNATAVAPAIIQFGNATLGGRYALTLSDPGNPALAAVAGSVIFDGSGNIPGGVLDTSDDAGTPLSVTGGSYQIGTDGRGTVTLRAGGRTFQLQLVMAGHASGFIADTDAAASGAAGTLDLQAAPAAIQGAYTVSVAGVTTGSGPSQFAEAGSINATGGAIAGGLLDLNIASATQAALPAGGSFSALSSDSRGTLTLTRPGGSQVFAYYPIDASRSKLVEIDGAMVAGGELFSQAAGPFPESSFTGPFAFSMNGTSGNAPFAIAGVFTVNGQGGVTNQVFDGVSQTVFDLNPGAYTVTDSSTGRATLTWTVNGGMRLNYVIYPRSDGGLVMLETDATNLSIGAGFHQSLIGLFLPPLGAFALQLGGNEAATPATHEQITGQVTRPGGTGYQGSVDLVGGSAITSGAPILLNFLNENSNNGRTVLAASAASTALTGAQVVFYTVNDKQSIVFESDVNRSLSGMLVRQF